MDDSAFTVSGASASPTTGKSHPDGFLSKLLRDPTNDEFILDQTRDPKPWCLVSRIFIPLNAAR
jgi:hypothetical protein